MSIVKLSEQGYFLGKDGLPFYVVGVNYVPSYAFINLWRPFNEDHIQKDLKQIAEMGLNCIRIPLFWVEFEPREGQYSQEFFDKFDRILAWCRQYNLYVQPWFFYGAARGPYDPPYRRNDGYFSERMTRIAENHLKAFVSRYKAEEQILVWDIADEPEWFTRTHSTQQLPYDREVIATWVRRMYDAIKSVDSEHIVTLAFGHICISDYGMDIRDMADILDVMTVTCYPGFSNDPPNEMRKAHFMSFFNAMNRIDQPSVYASEAPGFSSVNYSERILGQYYRQSLYSNLLNRGAGALVWSFTDASEDIWYQYPVDNWLSETGFGITKTDGQLKEQAQQLMDFARFVRKMDIPKYRWRNHKAALFIADGYFKNTSVSARKVYAHFLLARGAGLGVDMVYEGRDISKYDLLIVPTNIGLNHLSWRLLRKYVKEGGTLFFAYDGGLNGTFNDLFGVEVESDMFDNGRREMRSSIGGTFPDRLQTNKGGQYLWVTSRDAQTLYTYADGKPAVLCHPYGEGKAWLSTCSPVEGTYEMDADEYSTSPWFAFYRCLAETVGIEPAVQCVDPRIETGVMDDENGQSLALMINMSSQPISTSVTIPFVSCLDDLKDTLADESFSPADGRFSINFKPAQVRCFVIKRKDK
ncbi:MAG: beta-galactosidase trimerization domain-containing protein [Verrucomicrobia bacterium]|nr:beta-galactosidase trimerization domain-containing protein [Verrucomicrobiota bacterium]MBU4290595.1 beta-galactosidase trimerization domain-containing protein [Verrucomicrobiota bacterium]MBU4430202.1 beta-galactosidase trimerization domain-containing protein [Verrucomicrobiota bacterium]MCG2679504.1 beta-galactosidase trimerization domain-containing protein [Kiritimatiellia bacterium]